VVRPLRTPVRRFLPVTILLANLTLCIVFASPTQAQDQPNGQPSASNRSDADDIRQPGRLVLVLPFDNRSGQANLNWIGDSFPYTLNQRLSSAGFLTIAHEDRQYAFDHLGLPPDLRPTHATTLRVAQTLDADYVVVGSYTIKDGRISVQAQVLGVSGLRLSPPLEDSSEFSRLFDVENAIAWKVAQRMDPHFAIAEQTFIAAAGGVKLSSFEDYIRGTYAVTQEERLKRLQAAVTETPGYSDALLALGREQYAAREYDAAAATLAKIQPTDRLALEAGFYLGLARFNSAKYAEAAAAFAFVSSRLPLPEVVNNSGVALSLQNRDSTPLFEQAVNADPNDADYHFNLGVALLRRGDGPGATREVGVAVKLHPQDTEAIELLSRLDAAKGATVSLKPIVYAGGFEPITRIRRTWSEAGFRQAAFELDQVRGLRMTTLPPGEQAVQYSILGQEYLGQGLMPEAELQFQAALAADPRSASAHAGLAIVRERSGSTAEARNEAEASLKLTPNVSAYLVLGRLDLAANDLPTAAVDTANALNLEPKNSAALGLKTALQQRGQVLP
jgi:tetratricopeptide (TPR) repeat protein